MLLTEQLLSCPGCVFWVVVMLEEPSSMLLSQHMALSILPSIRCRKASPKNDVFTSMLHGWDGVLGVLLIFLLLPPPNTASRSKNFFFCLIRPHDLLQFVLCIIQRVTGKLQTRLDMHWFEQGTLCAL